MTPSNLSSALQQLSTPFYIYDLDWFRRRARHVIETLSAFDGAYFAIMANFNRDVLKVLLESGAGLFTQSKANIDLGIQVGFPSDKIICAGSNHSIAEISEIGRSGVMYFANSASQFKAFTGCTGGNAGLRINVGEPFRRVELSNPAPRLGLTRDELMGLSAKEKVKVSGLHVYLGTNIHYDDLYIKALEYILEVAKFFPNCEVIDLGGGFSVNYLNEKEFSLELFNSHISALIDGKDYKLLCEPGRYLSAGGGWLVVTVTDITERCNERGDVVRYIGVDTSMSSFPRSFVHKALLSPPIVLGKSSADSSNLPRAMICGATTFSEDFLMKDVMLPHVSIGDRIVFPQAGAYQYSMAMDFLGYPRPAEYVYSDGVTKISRDAMLPAGYGGYPS